MARYLTTLTEIKNSPEIKGLLKDASSAHLFYDLVDEMDAHYTKKEIFDSAKFTLDFFKKNKLTKLNFGTSNQLKLERSNPIMNLHSESIIEYHIKKEKKLISTFGFYFTVSHGKVTLRISNIQGNASAGYYENKENVLHLNKKNIDILNKEISDNWRIKIVKFLSNYASLNKMNISVELPMKTGNSKSDYIRQLRQYIQTALKAGLSVENISTKRINDEAIKEKINKNLEIKKNRLLENKKASSLISKSKKDVFKKKIIKRK